MCTPCLRYHSIDGSNGPFGGGIRFPSFQNENEPQCPPCGRQIAARLSSVPPSFRCSPVLLRSARGKKKYWHSLTHLFPVVWPTGGFSKRKGKRDFPLLLSPVVVCLFISPTYASIWNLLPLHLGLGWVDERDTSQSAPSEQLFRAKIPILLLYKLLYERDGGLCAATNWLVQQVCKHSTGIGGLQWRFSAGSLCLDNSTRSEKNNKTKDKKICFKSSSYVQT